MLRALFLVAAVLHGASALTPTRQPLAALRIRGGSTKTPPETYSALAEKGAANANAPTPKLLHAAFMGGAYVAIGGVFALIVAGAFPQLAPELQRLIVGAIFPIGLVFILQAAGQLMTGNFAVVTAALYEGKIDLQTALRSYVLTGLGNLAGTLTIATAVREAGLLQGGMAKMVAGMAAKKCAGALLPTLIKAVLCNWLVSLAIFLASSCADMPGKTMAIWMCIPTFVTIGLEHSVANMFFLPLGKMAGADVSVMDMLMKNLLIVTLGNFIGGGIVLAGGMSFQFGALGA